LPLGPGVATIEDVTEPVVQKEELEAAIEARKELGADLEPALVDAFVERIERRLAQRGDDDERSLQRKREHQKEMVLGAMGISIPLLAIAAIFAGLAGVVAVCVALAVIAIVSAR
jgi:Flp pilus assembly protein TadB